MAVIVFMVVGVGKIVRCRFRKARFPTKCLYAPPKHIPIFGVILRSAAAFPWFSPTQWLRRGRRSYDGFPY